MSAITIRRHKCDNCGLQFDEVEGEGFIPSGGPKNWSAWNNLISPVRKEGTPSYFYGTINATKEFCNYDCAIEWMKKEKDRLG